MYSSATGDVNMNDQLADEALVVEKMENDILASEQSKSDIEKQLEVLSSTLRKNQDDLKLKTESEAFLKNKLESFDLVEKEVLTLKMEIADLQTSIKTCNAKYKTLLSEKDKVEKDFQALTDQLKLQNQEVRQSVANNTDADVFKDMQSHVGQLMEDELNCSICRELFINPVTLGCSHSFCGFCITEWQRNKKDCPICRMNISTAVNSPVIDNFINKMMCYMPASMKSVRDQLTQERPQSGILVSQGLLVPPATQFNVENISQILRMTADEFDFLNSDEHEDVDYVDESVDFDDHEDENLDYESVDFDYQDEVNHENELVDFDEQDVNDDDEPADFDDPEDVNTDLEPADFDDHEDVDHVDDHDDASVDFDDHGDEPADFDDHEDVDHVDEPADFDNHEDVIHVVEPSDFDNHEDVILVDDSTDFDDHEDVNIDNDSVNFDDHEDVSIDNDSVDFDDRDDYDFEDY